jgi:two-component system chemotaxis response regulator CheY
MKANNLAGRGGNMKKLLLADDSASVRSILKGVLFKDFELIEAENGKVALEKAAAERVDGFVVDVNMPEMDGITLVGKLRERSEYRTTPIVILTTESQENKKQEGKAAGATGWVVKPVEPEKLLALMRRLVP